MMAVYMFSFIVILWKMKKNDEQSKLAEKADEAVFTWKVFTSWDYGIAGVEAAHNKVAAAVQHFHCTPCQVSAILMELREAILEDAEREKEQQQDWRTIAKRVAAMLCMYS